MTLRKLALRIPRLKTVLLDNDRLRQQNDSLKKELAALQLTCSKNQQSPQEKEWEPIIKADLERSFRNNESNKDWWEHNHRNTHTISPAA